MDINDLRMAITLLSFLLFAGIVAWAMAPSNRRALDEARQLPFLDTGADDE